MEENDKAEGAANAARSLTDAKHCDWMMGGDEPEDCGRRAVWHAPPAGARSFDLFYCDEHAEIARGWQTCLVRVDATPEAAPSDSVSAELREARRLLREAQQFCDGLVQGGAPMILYVHEAAELRTDLAAFLGERSDAADAP